MPHQTTTLCHTHNCIIERRSLESTHGAFWEEDNYSKITQPTMPVKPIINKCQIGRSLDYQGPRRKFASSASCGKLAKKIHKLNILQINVQGLQRKTQEIQQCLSTHEVHVALLQETILPSKKKIHISGYTMYNCNYKNCQGILTLIRNDIEATVINKTASDIDHQMIQVWPRGKKNVKYTLHNIYYPNKSNNKFPEMDNILKRTVVAGDFNSHLPSLGYPTYNNRGNEVEELCNSTNLIMLQNHETPPTFFSRSHGTTSRPDLTLVSADVLNNTNIEVLDDIGSDHKPILTSIIIPQQKAHVTGGTSWNYRKANWNLFRQKTDELLTQTPEPDSLDKNYKQLISSILKAAKRCIPMGKRKKFKPHWSPELSDAVSQRKKARKQVEKDPSTKNKTEYNRLTAKVRFLSKKCKSTAFRETCSNIDLKKDGHKAWRLVNNLEGSKRKTNPQPLNDNFDNLVTSGKCKAKLLNKTFAQVSKTTKRKELDEALLRKTQRPKSGHAAAFDDPFSTYELNRALKKLANKKAPGPDNITNEMLKHLGPKSKEVMLSFINRTWNEGSLPSLWRTAIITPLLKKGKPVNSPKSFRPISLTSCMGKLAEKMVNTRLYYWLEENKLLDNAQAGFRRGCRTEDPLFRLAQNVIDGFQAGKSTIAVFVDLQQAYDRVWRKGLLLKLHNTGVHGKMFKWIKGFLTNRTIATKCDGALSSKRTLEEGLPQGSALSCTLFLVYINDLVKHIGVSKALFADDLAIWTTVKNPILAKTQLNRALLTISTFCNLWKLKANIQKTVYSIFSRSHEIAKNDLNLKMDGKLLRKEQTPVYLGVKLDTQMNMSEHMKSLREKTAKRLNLIKHLASTKWGADKLTLRQLYMGYVRSVLENSLSLQTLASQTNQTYVDRIQNQAVRFMCGGMRSTPAAACEIEADIEPLDIRRSRALTETVERYKRLEKDHPNRKLVENWQQINRLKQNSLLDKALENERIYHLPENRQQETKCPQPTPWETLKQPSIKTFLLDQTATKHSDPNVLKLSTLETINSYPQSAIHVYTDGSAFRATKFAGFGVFLRYPDNSTEHLSDCCGNNCSNYEAEIIAIKSSIELLHQQFETNEKEPTDVVIFSDSSSALDALQNPPFDCIELEEASKSMHILLDTFNINLNLQWIPGHTDIFGNEIADQLAKKGANKPQFDNPCSMNTAKRILRNQSKEEWLNRWAAGTTGRAVFKEKSKPNKNDNINKLFRPDQCRIFQFRTGHAKVNMHLNRIDPQHNPTCRHCQYPYETTVHILFECTNLKDHRKKLLPMNPNINNTLYGPLSQLRLTANFIRLAIG